MRISSADFIKNYGSISDKALSEAVTITRNGRERLVLLSAEEYARLKRRDRQVLLAEDLTATELDGIAQAEVPDEHAVLDEELRDWQQ